jgi:hypothetical protein
MFGMSVRKTGALRAVLLGSVAASMIAPAQAAETVDIEALEQQMQILIQEIQALKSQQLEQARTIEEQNKKLNAQGQEIQAQQEQVEAVEEAVVAAPAQAVTGGDHPGSFKLPSSNTSMKIGGYTKGDLYYDVNQDLGDTFNTVFLMPDGTPTKDPSFRAHARQTRVNLTTWTPTDVGQVKTFIEGDFFGDGGNELLSNSTALRLRHAFGQLSTENWDFLIGQTWTNFMGLKTIPDTIDFHGPTGFPFVRQGQARATYKGVENVKVSVSLENSEFTGHNYASTILGSETTGVGFGVDSLPDATAAVEYNKDGYHVKVSAVGRKLKVDTAGGAPKNDSEFAYGLFGGVVIPTIGKDKAIATVAYGDGIGRYLIDGIFQDGFVDATGDLETIEQLAFTAAYHRQWDPEWSSNAVFGRTEFLDTNLMAPTAAFGVGNYETLTTVHVNTWWAPATNFRFGLEYMYGMKEFKASGFDNHASRIGFAGQFFF